MPERILIRELALCGASHNERNAEGVSLAGSLTADGRVSTIVDN